jgi:NAD(P)-dependent dehydrogenase (short-subunit alcohol dehydrogenase family)
MTPHSRLFDLTGKAAIVTGASSGLGWQFALTLAQAGAKVAVAARRVEPLTALTEEIAAFDGRAIPVCLDVTDPDSIKTCVAAAETDLGPISILVNNAGIAKSAPPLETGEADWDSVIDVNLKGAWLMAQETARHMVAMGQGGTIINVASIYGLVASARLPAYCASKGAVISLTRSLALAFAPHEIRVNAIAPGYIETDLNREFLASPAGREIIARIPQRRCGTPQDLDGVLLLLASDASRFMTGSTLVVDGGQTASI